MATTSDLPASHRAMVRRLSTIRRRLERVNASWKALEDERTQAYLAARALDPPMTFKAIADVFGVTEAAVMQKVTRHEKAQAAKS